MDRRTVVVGLGASVIAPRFASAQAASPLGVWSTVIYTEDVVRPQRWRFEFRADGAHSFVSVDQPLFKRKAPRLRARISGSQVTFEIPDLDASFKGKLIAPDRIDGVFDFPAEGGKRPMLLSRGEPDMLTVEVPRLTSQRLDQLRRADGLAGIAVAVAKRGATTRIWAAGERKRGSGVLISQDDRWPIASCSKSFTAALIGRLVDQGKVDWDDTIGDVLGKQVPNMLPFFQTATLRHVLTHRAGLVQDTAPRIARRFSFDLDDAPADRLTSARYALSQEPVGPMGAAHYSYSNVGYQIAGAMIETRTGRAYETLMSAEVFVPLGLASASFERLTGQTNPDGTPMLTGHPPTMNGGAAVNPAGGVALTLSDLLVYLAAHRDESDFLKPETWRALHSDPFGHEYAMGWHVEDIENGGLIHGGAFPGWMSKIAFNQLDGTVMAAATNDRTGRAEALLTQCMHEGSQAFRAPQAS